MREEGKEKKEKEGSVVITKNFYSFILFRFLLLLLLLSSPSIMSETELIITTSSVAEQYVQMLDKKIRVWTTEKVIDPVIMLQIIPLVDSHLKGKNMSYASIRKNEPLLGWNCFLVSLFVFLHSFGTDDDLRSEPTKVIALPLHTLSVFHASLKQDAEMTLGIKKFVDSANQKIENARPTSEGIFNVITAMNKGVLNGENLSQIVYRMTVLIRGLTVRKDQDLGRDLVREVPDVGTSQTFREKAELILDKIVNTIRNTGKHAKISEAVALEIVSSSPVGLLGYQIVL